MAPLTQAIRSSFSGERDGARVYTGEVDNVWTVLAVPHGGYALGLIISSCMSSQAATTHPEVVHVTGHFLQTTSPGHFEVHIRTLRMGGSYWNLAADLIQNAHELTIPRFFPPLLASATPPFQPTQNQVKIAAHLIFKTVASAQGADARLTLLPSSPYGRRIPLHTHPSLARVTPFFHYANFHAHVTWAEDEVLRARNLALAHAERPAAGGGGLEWGAWLQLPDPGENLNAAFFPFLGDVMRSLPELLPKHLRPAVRWYPTLVLAVEYKARIPDDPAFSKSTVGLYSCSRFLNAGQHEIDVEIWTAPTGIGEGVEDEGWRERQVCLGIARQMALTVTTPANERTGAGASGKL